MISKELLREFTVAVRQSTLKRLLKVPKGYECWKISPGSLSFAEVAQHLIDIDEWLIRKIETPDLKSIKTQTAIMDECSREKFINLINGLKETLEKKLKIIDNFMEEDLKKKLYDDSYDTEMSMAMLILRRNLDHETHHRGQLAVYLRVLETRLDQIT
ncbi:MAG: DinB family protein [Ignavibacteria bacterium]|jgi:uncharacterized damage-inducible protein DinB